MYCAGTWVLLAASVVLTGSSLFGNPYSSIAARNVFHLKEPPPVVPFIQPAPPRVAPKLVLTGIADFSTIKWAFVTRTDPGAQPKNYTLNPGETEGGLQIIDLNVRAGTVVLRVDEIDTVTLQLSAAKSEPPKAVPAGQLSAVRRMPPPPPPSPRR
jgi:hypothetical protein